MDTSKEEKDRFCAFISAFCRGDVGSVKRIISEGFDVLSNKHRSSSYILMSCIRGHCEILKYFITLGVDVNEKDSKGKNAVYHCATSGQLECLKILVDNGADLDVKCDGMTLLQQASLDGKANIVEYLISLPSCTRAAKIEALELLGASYASKRNDLQGARDYWLRSLEERGRAEPGDNVPPKRDEPHPVFGNVREFQTERELTALAFSMDEMWMQSLLIRERIFGPEHEYSPEYVVDRAIAYAYRGNFDKSIWLIAHGLDVEHKSGVVCRKTLESLWSDIDKLSIKMFDRFPVRYRDVMAMFVKLVDIIKLDMKPQLHQKQPWNCTTYDRAFYAPLRLISILAQLPPLISVEESLQLCKDLYRFVHLNLRDRKGRTPLHLACVDNMTLYSPLDMVRLLLEFGADPQAVTLSRDTPLHTLASNRHPSQPDIIKLLLNSGAHYDACNMYGKCFTEYLNDDNVFKFENPLKYLSLKCLSAKVVKKHGIPFESEVPSCVSAFIKIH